MSEIRIPTEYTLDDLKIVEQQEKELVFSCFNNIDSFQIVQSLQSIASNYENGIGVAIELYDIENKIPVLLYTDPNKTERHLNYLRRKRNVVIETGHCSFWAFVKNSIDGSFENYRIDNENYALTGGSYPIYVNDKLTYTLSASGLHFGKDQEILVLALCKYLAKEPLQFTKELW